MLLPVPPPHFALGEGSGCIGHSRDIVEFELEGALPPPLMVSC